MAEWISLDLAECRPLIPALFGRDVNPGMSKAAFGDIGFFPEQCVIDCHR